MNMSEDFLYMELKAYMPNIYIHDDELYKPVSIDTMMRNSIYDKDINKRVIRDNAAININDIMPMLYIFKNGKNQYICTFYYMYNGPTSNFGRLFKNDGSHYFDQEVFIIDIPNKLLYLGQHDYMEILNLEPNMNIFIAKNSHALYNINKDICRLCFIATDKCKNMRELVYKTKYMGTVRMIDILNGRTILEECQNYMGSFDGTGQFAHYKSKYIDGSFVNSNKLYRNNIINLFCIAISKKSFGLKYLLNKIFK